MKDTTFTELRNHAKRYFDAVEAGQTVRVFEWKADRRNRTDSRRCSVRKSRSCR